MDTIFFMLLHICALLFGGIWLLITIPLHIIFSAINRRNVQQEQDRPRPDTHVRCPDYAELVLREARKCKHCGCRLQPS